jgi:hypothetical protein
MSYKKIVILSIVLGLLPITAVPANAAVCTYKSRQSKNYSDQAYTKYEYKKARVCK